MIKFGQLVEKGMATYKVNPISQAFGVIIFEDRMEDKDKNYSILLNEKEYKLSVNPFDNNIKDVTLDTNQISEDQLKEASIIVY